MRVVVTGGTGRIGRALVDRLVTGGTDVTLLVRPGGNGTGRTCGPDVRRVEVDLLAEREVARAVGGVDVLYHLALSRSADGPFRPIDARTNLDMLRTVLTAAARAGPGRVVYASSVAVYGTVPPAARPVAEDGPLGGHQPYMAHKLVAEGMMDRLCSRAGIEHVTVRPSFVYGPGVLLAEWFLCTLLACPRWSLARPQPLHPVLEMGRISHWLHVEDAARALELVGSRAGVAAGPYNIVGDRGVRRAELLSLALAALGLGTRAPGGSAELYDGTRARRELGFTAQVPIEEGVAEVLSGLRSRAAHGTSRLPLSR
jgi:UDP-glucose 4-epimerase